VITCVKGIKSGFFGFHLKHVLLYLKLMKCGEGLEVENVTYSHHYIGKAVLRGPTYKGLVARKRRR